MWGNPSWKDGLTKEEILAAEQWAGAKRVAQNMAEGMFTEFCKGWNIPPPKVFLPCADRKKWEVHVTYPVGDSWIIATEPYDTFPSEELIATLMMLGLKR